ncbi:hypothetical protein KR018_008944 [Drosophila ironensis]|nr:hypothetical protein KR018_008944 [Drosophila ironensis]
MLRFRGPRSYNQRSLGMNIHNDEPLLRTPMGDGYPEWNGPREWNGVGNPGHKSPPAAPMNLSWKTPPRGGSPVHGGPRHRALSPNPQCPDMAYRHFEEQIMRGRGMVDEFGRFMADDRCRPDDPDLEFLQDFHNSTTVNPLTGNWQSFPVQQDESSGFYSNNERQLGNENNDRDMERFGSNDWQSMGKKRRGEAAFPMDHMDHKRLRPEVTDKLFAIGGYKLPYVTLVDIKWPQPESKSFAVRFFKRLPNYRIRPKTKQYCIYQVYDEKLTSADFAKKDGRYGLDVQSGSAVGRIMESVNREWIKIYRGRNYRTWEGWWQDFRNIDVDIFAQLEKFPDYNVQYNFMPLPGTLDDAGLVIHAQIALTKNRINFVGNMRFLYHLVNPTVLGNLPFEAVGQVQDMIRSIPNHLWIYKMRSMVYTWYNYSQVMLNGKDVEDEKYQHVAKEWKCPVIHWLAKQAFFELKSISKFEFPEYKNIFGSSLKPVKN